VTDLTDEEYMRIALDLAEKARGYTSPNPLVGCVIVAPDGKIVGRGYHHKAGTPHAEVNAMADAGDKVRGATAYVTLEPCSHYGRTGPCCEALIKAGIRKVVAATGDPNPRVSGRGFARLREAGVEVVTGILEKEARRQNEVFMHWMTTGRPFTVLKYAMTLDGKIATASGDSKWITSEASRRYAHRLRAWYDAILVGKGTVLADDPSLTCRLVEGNNPVRVILDTHAELPTDRKVFTDGAAKTILVVSEKVPQERWKKMSEIPQVTVLPLPEKDGHIDLEALLDALGKESLTSLLVEGGSAVLGAFLDARLAQRVYAFIAPSLIGGKDNLTAIGGKGASTMDERITLQEPHVEEVGPDVMVTGLLERS
jgi:diaminohydroxyphosphoribosylaminopyrimidine deaminase/5-amino-6-(5-phosphoribosylamino)uracil reductase